DARRQGSRLSPHQPPLLVPLHDCRRPAPLHRHQRRRRHRLDLHPPAMPAPGLTCFPLPLFVWAMYAAAIIMILGTPVVAVTIVLVAVERIFHFGFFDPALGGDPLLFQHLFWFYSHPAVYVMLLPSMGIISE